MSTAERVLRERTKAIVARISSGAKPYAAMGASGYANYQTRRILSIAAGGEPQIDDPWYREACEAIAQAITTAASEQDALLAERWRELAIEGDDWRSIAELLKRRNPDEWAVTERSEVELAGGVEMRSEDAVLAALARLKGEATGDE